MIAYTPKAAEMVRALRQHYERRGRVEAIIRLDRALQQAERVISQDPAAGLSAPRPYPGLAQPGRRWTKTGSYWIAYSTTLPPVIVGVFHDRSDIPTRV